MLLKPIHDLKDMACRRNGFQHGANATRKGSIADSDAYEKD